MTDPTPPPPRDEDEPVWDEPPPPDEADERRGDWPAAEPIQHVDLVKRTDEVPPPSPEEEAETAPQPAEDGRPAAVPAPDRGLVRLLAAAVAALLLLTGFLTYQVIDHRGPAPVEASRSEALEAGREAARLVFSYDYRKLDADFKAGQAVTTGKFRKDYESTTKKLVGDVAPRYKAVLVAEVSEASVITASEDRALLLVFLNVQSTSSLTTAPKITPRRLKMTMQREGDRWLVADVDAF